MFTITAPKHANKQPFMGFAYGLKWDEGVATTDNAELANRLKKRGYKIAESKTKKD